MAYPRVELGGHPIALEAGAIAQQYDPLGDGGAAWRRIAIRTRNQSWIDKDGLVAAGVAF